MRGLIAFALMGCAACSSSSTPVGTTSTTTGAAAASTTGAATTTTGASASTTGAATTVGSSTSGTTSGAATTSGGTSGTTGSLPACAPGAVWSGNTCLVSACTLDAGPKTACLLGDGGGGTCFNATCVDLDSDPQNCGLAGIVCPPGSSCVGTICRQPDGGLPCANPATAGCAVGQICDDAEIGCAVVDCTGAADGVACGTTYGNFCCGGSCLSGSEDPANCGACGVTCPSGVACFEGACATQCLSQDNAQCESDAGQSGFCCGGSCVLFGADADSSNCGGCGRGCAVGQTCTTGYCSGAESTCAAGQVDIPGYGCYPTACAASAQTGSSCAITQSNGLIIVGGCCGSACVVTDSDAQSCGGCGLACPTGSVCVGGNCEAPPDCAKLEQGATCFTTSGAAGLCCQGSCVDPKSDASNCNGCGQGCPSGDNCAVDPTSNQAVCAQPGGPSDVGCSPTSPCASGKICANGQCRPVGCAGLPDEATCLVSVDGGLGTCCDSVCTQVYTDDSNCAVCGVVCPTGTICNGGNCVVGSTYYDCEAPGAVSCPAGTACDAFERCSPLSCAGRSNGDSCAVGINNDEGTCCGGQCVNVRADPANCGACGETCAGACNDFVCQALLPTSCQQTCAADQTCVDGACVGSQCTTGTYCLARDGQTGTCCDGQTCADFQSDVDNCGGCDIACPAGKACTNGQCLGSTCGGANPYAFCETGDLNKVCCGATCADITSDPANCGACGLVCASGSCVASVCQ